MPKTMADPAAKAGQSNAEKLPSATSSTVADLTRHGLITLSWFLILVSGYFLSYQIFFTETPLEQVARSRARTVRIVFKYLIELIESSFQFALAACR